MTNQKCWRGWRSEVRWRGDFQPLTKKRSISTDSDGKIEITFSTFQTDRLVISPSLSLKYMGYCWVFSTHHRFWRITGPEQHYAAPVSPLASLPVTTGEHGGLQSFPRLSQGEYKGRSVRSLPASPVPSLWTGRPCQQLPAPSHYTALHVPTGSDRLGADRSTQHPRLMHAHTHLVVPCLPTGDADTGMCRTHKTERGRRNMGRCLFFAFSMHSVTHTGF